MYRPGAVTFMTKLEHELFPPYNQSLNDLYTVHYMQHEKQPCNPSWLFSTLGNQKYLREYA